MPLDSAPIPGNPNAQEIYEIERHFHTWERWFGAAVTPSGEVHVADRIGPGVAAFQADAGDNTWSTWLQILGSADTPVDAGNTIFDLHRLQVVAVERTASAHFVQVAQGASGAAAYAAGTYTELVFHPLGQQGQRVPIPLLDLRMDAGTKTWIRIMVPSQNTGTMDFYHGLHEYLT